MCFDIDGRFPNHEANPLIEENRRDIVERVVAEKADVGIAWGGDADRCFFIDGSGEFVAGDFITARLAEAFLLKHPERHQHQLDGLSVENPDWHFNVRPSNTEPLLRLNLEATTADQMAAKRDEVLALIRS